MIDITTAAPDPYDPAAVEIADELYARMRRVRFGTGHAITGSGILGRTRQQVGLASSAGRLTPAEHDWLQIYAAAAVRKRRDDRERERRERRAR